MSTAESDILTRVVSPDDSSLDQRAAEAILAMGFKAGDRQRMAELAEKARRGELSEEEQSETDSYERIGHFVALLKSKARRSLKAG